MSSYGFMLRPTWTISDIFATSQNSISNLKKKSNFGFWCYSTREDLSIDASITNVGLILTKLRWFQLFVTNQNSISNFFEKIQIFGFQYCSTCEDLSVDVSITNVGLISTKSGRFLFSGYGQNSIPSISIFLKKIQFLGFQCYSICENLPIDVSITNAGLILTKPGRFLFSGYGQMDRHGFGILTWKHVGTQKISTQSSKLVVSRRSLYASPQDGDA